MDTDTLKSVSDLPVPFRSAFSFRYFNSLQSECFPLCFHSDTNMVISAPTGSGKTVLFELCILRLLSKSISKEGRFYHAKGTLKTVYISPSKALVQEKLRDWSQKFNSWGINCLELTGDNETYNIRNIQEADIILTTPEKFDAVSRYRVTSGGLGFFSDIALLLIDEVHLLNDPRGAALEAIVSRIKILSSSPELRSSPLANVRLLAVSATIPNIEDLAEWLKVPAPGVKRFGEEMRPVKLTTKVFGYAAAKNDFLFEKRLQNYIYDILMQYSKGKSALVFCSTRKGAQEAAQLLAQVAMTYGYSNPFIKSKEQLDRLREASLACGDKQMQSYILLGVGYHNGGLSQKDRSLVEGLFLCGDVQVLCTTNTLAHGINLPAHTVIIKSTQHFNKEKGLYMEYDRSMILQMCGRAGRPPFDDTGMVIIMTRRETVHLYENLLSGCEIVESQLLPCLTEHLTAEIVQLTISDITRAIEWMKCSYLYVRMKKNPENYAIRKGIPKDRVEKHLQEVCVQKISELSRYQMIWTDSDGFVLKPQEPGRLMTKYYLKFNTMKYIMHAPAVCSLEEALHVVCRAEEISWIQLRRNEKKTLNDINMDKEGRLRFHVNDNKGKRKKRIQTREEKVFVLVNDWLTGDPSAHDLSMTQDANSICSNGCRIARCMKEYFVYKKNYKGFLSSTLLTKSLYQKLWDDSPYLLKQLLGIGMVTAKALHSMGVRSFEALAEADPRRIEIVTGRKYPFGNHIKESLSSLPPKVDITVREVECQKQGISKIAVTLTRLSEPLQSTKRHYADMIVGTEEENLIHFHEKIRMDDFSSPYSTTILLERPQQAKVTVKVDLIFEEYIGLDLHETLVLKKCNSAKVNYERRTSLPRRHPSSDVCKVEKDNKIESSMSAQKDQNTSMPTFKLIDEDSGEENEPHISMEEDDCMIINERTVFDHIREKAKRFPSLSTWNPASPTPEKPTRKRNSLRGEFPELSAEFHASQETPRNQIPQDPMLRTDAKDDEQNINPAENQGETQRPFSGETIFDHIRKKSKNFPVLNASKIDHPQNFLPRSNHSGIEHLNADPIIISCLEGGNAEAISSENCSRAYGMLSPSLKRASVALDPSPVEMLSFDISMMKRNTKQEEELGSSQFNTMKRKGLCSLVPGKSDDSDSFLGFKSIFSFL
ncbi:PREDICTED: DExH-box ATP-dependent RNA helicase DExH17 isoform X2 [Tarenaya hassleriana]|uniref:DExH-box ATP-dependent RNA helicase DExH17 isoform X2 n=1 Tax=Tarenaya hassleriana TaxID=28532 RepID=UPI00053C7F3A|nr:PREDICTED: DExH-box ATP-dependent RNA helicase DExH17 isoform X2 [Tarenaya hassleriana]